MNSKKRTILLVGLMMIITSSLVPVMATTTESAPWDTPLQSFVNWISGPLPRIIGVIMIVGGFIMVGVTEGAALKVLFWVIIAIGGAVNAWPIMNQFFPNASGFLIF